MSYFIRAASLTGFEDLVKYYGANPVHILKEVGILPSQLRDPDELISYEKCLDVLELAATQCNTDTFGLRLSSTQGIKTVGLVGAYMCRQDTVEEALLVAQKYIYMHAQGMMLTFDITDEGYYEVKYQQLIDVSLTYPQKSQLTLGVIYKVMNELIGFKWHAKKVTFKQSPNKEDIQVFHQIFDCDIEFNVEFDSLYFDAYFLKQKPIVHEELTSQIISRQFENQKSSQETDIISLIEHTVRVLLATGECNRENIAVCIGIHPKKMQRMLKDNQTSYQEILDNVRKNEALRVLEAGNANLTNLALNLGYAEFSAFSRRFKHWFGVSPSKWNSRQR